MQLQLPELARLEAQHALLAEGERLARHLIERALVDLPDEALAGAARERPVPAATEREPLRPLVGDELDLELGSVQTVAAGVLGLIDERARARQRQVLEEAADAPRVAPVRARQQHAPLGLGSLGVLCGGLSPLGSGHGRDALDGNDGHASGVYAEGPNRVALEPRDALVAQGRELRPEGVPPEAIDRVELLTVALHPDVHLAADRRLAAEREHPWLGGIGPDLDPGAVLAQAERLEVLGGVVDHTAELELHEAIDHAVDCIAVGRERKRLLEVPALTLAHQAGPSSRLEGQRQRADGVGLESEDALLGPVRLFAPRFSPDLTEPDPGSEADRDPEQDERAAPAHRGPRVRSGAATS